MVIPVILCGGSGTRLWPLSRTAYPKQLHPLINEKSLLQQTIIRMTGLPQMGQPMIICNQDYRFIVAEQCRDLDVQAQIILESTGKNTAPAATLAALLLEQQKPNDLMLVLPADHIIQPCEPLEQSIQQAAALIHAHPELLVTFGVVPLRPETGYGYIQKGESLGKDAFTVKQFVEKPDEATAEHYIRSQAYFWNSGMFIFKPSSFLREMQRHAPDILEICRHCAEHIQKDMDFHRIPIETFARCRSDSIDYAVMERSDTIAVVALNADWNDVGSWSAMSDIHPKDSSGNVLQGDVVATHVKNSYLRSESRLLAATGVSDLIVIETSDAVLVTHQNQCQEVKKLVSLLKNKNRPETEKHRKDYRPWGYYDILHSGPNFQIKRLVVKSMAKLSLQMHYYRSEHWIVLRGTATVTCGEKIFELQANQSTFISAATQHRLENNTPEPLELIEVQTGSYFGEDDIIRFEDLYQREATQ